MPTSEFQSSLDALKHQHTVLFDWYGGVIESKWDELLQDPQQLQAKIRQLSQMVGGHIDWEVSEGGFYKHLTEEQKAGALREHLQPVAIFKLCQMLADPGSVPEGDRMQAVKEGIELAARYLKEHAEAEEAAEPTP